MKKITLKDVATHTGYTDRQLRKYKSGEIPIKSLSHLDGEAYTTAKDKFLRNAMIGLFVTNNTNDIFQGTSLYVEMADNKQEELERLVMFGETYGQYMSDEFIENIIRIDKWGMH